MEPLKILTAEEILGAADSSIEFVDVPEWGGRVGVKVMTGTERDAYEAAAYRLREGNPADKASFFQHARARLVASTACNEKGELLFTTRQLVELGAKSSTALDLVFDKAQRLNKLRAEDVKTEAGKSATSAPSGEPGSATPPSSAAPSASSSPS